MTDTTTPVISPSRGVYTKSFVSTVPGSRTEVYEEQPYNLTSEGAISPAFSFTVPAGKVLLGKFSKVETTCVATKNDGSEIESTDSISLTEYAGNVLYDNITMHVNGSVIYSNSSADASRNEFDQHYYSTNADRSSGQLAHRQITSDARFIASNNPSTDYYHKTIIQGKKEFTLIRPLDDLPLMSDKDQVIPPNTTISLGLKTNPYLYRVFKVNTSQTSVVNKLIIKSVKVWFTLEDVDDNLAREYIELQLSNNYKTNTVIREIRSVGIINASDNIYISPTLRFGSSPDLLAVLMYPVATSATLATYNILVKHLPDEARITKDSTTTIYKDPIRYLAALERIRGKQPYNSGNFVGISTGAIGGVYIDYHENDYPHTTIKPSTFSFRLDVSSQNRDLEVFVYTETTKKYIISPTGVTEQL